jgi:hypothetical protein
MELETGQFDFIRYVNHIKTNLAVGGVFRLWNVHIKTINDVNPDGVMRFVYTNTQTEADFNSGVFKFVRKTNEPTFERQILVDVTIPGKMILNGDMGVVTVTSIRGFHCVLSKNQEKA